AEQPAHVGEGESLGERLPVVAEPPRRMRVAFFVAVLVVPPVIGHPDQDFTLDGEAARDGHRDLQAPDRLERTVREVAVEAHADPHAGDHVEHERDDDVMPAEAPSPGQRHRRGDGQQRDDDEHADQEPVQAAGRLGVDLGDRHPPGNRGCLGRGAPGGSGRPGKGGRLGGSGHREPRSTVGRRGEAQAVRLGHAPRSVRDHRTLGERCDTYVTVTYETVGCTTPAGKLYQEVEWAAPSGPKAVSLSETRTASSPRLTPRTGAGRGPAKGERRTGAGPGPRTGKCERRTAAGEGTRGGCGNPSQGAGPRQAMGDLGRQWGPPSAPKCPALARRRCTGTSAPASSTHAELAKLAPGVPARWRPGWADPGRVLWQAAFPGGLARHDYGFWSRQRRFKSFPGSTASS